MDRTTIPYYILFLYVRTIKCTIKIKFLSVNKTKMTIKPDQTIILVWYGMLCTKYVSEKNKVQFIIETKTLVFHFSYGTGTWYYRMEQKTRIVWTFFFFVTLRTFSVIHNNKKTLRKIMYCSIQQLKHRDDTSKKNSQKNNITLFLQNEIWCTNSKIT